MPEAAIVSTAEIAKLAGVRTGAVTNWRQRHSDFPAPHGPEEPPRFLLHEVIAWLDRRKIPADARDAGEPLGTTYGDRVRVALPGLSPDERTKDKENTERLTSWLDKELWPALIRRHGAVDVTSYTAVVLGLLYIRVTSPPLWEAVVQATAEKDQDLPVRISKIVARHNGDDLAPTTRELTIGVDNLEATIDLIGQIPLGPAKNQLLGPDTPGAVAFRYLLAQFDSQSKGGGEHLTPEPVTRLMARLLALQPDQRVYDPCCGTGSLLIAAALECYQEHGKHGGLVIGGAAIHELPRRLAQMQLQLHGIDAHVDRDAIRRLTHPADTDAPRYDAVLSNPPFATAWRDEDIHARVWAYGEPSRTDAGYAWLQHALELLSSQGRAAMVLPPAAAWQDSPRARATRTALVQTGAVEAVIALPSHLFARTSIPVHLWLLRKVDAASTTAPADTVLFIDAGDLGEKARRNRSTLTNDAVNRIVGAYRAWQRQSELVRYRGEPGLARAVPRREVLDTGNLDPRTWLDATAESEHRVTMVADLRRLRSELADVERRAAEIDAAAAAVLRRVLP